MAVKVPGYNVTYKCAVVETIRGGQSGKMIMIGKEGFDTLYFEKQNLAHMKRMKVSQVPKKLAEHTKTWRKTTKTK